MCREQIIIDRVERAFGIKKNVNWWKGLTKQQREEIRVLAEYDLSKEDTLDDVLDGAIMFARAVIKEYEGE